MKASVVSNTVRLHTLDGLRGIAILLVLLFHMQPSTPVATSCGIVLRAVGGFGWMGVDLFFVLSGFLITGILLDTREHKNYYRTFYLRRILRIVPLYYVVLFLWHFAGPYFTHHGTVEITRFRADEPWLVFHLTNLQIARSHRWTALATSHFWSLAVEEQFYLLWPFFVRSLPRKIFLSTCAALIVSVACLRTLARLTGLDSRTLYVLLPTRADTLLVGSLLAGILRDHPDWFRPVFAARIGCAILGALSLAVLGAITTHHIAWIRSDGALMQHGGYTLIAMGAGAMVTLAASADRNSSTHQILSSPLLQFFGKYSYGIYVFHFLVKAPVEQWFCTYNVATKAQFPNLFLVTQLSVGVLVSVLLARVSWHLLEAPFLKLKNRIVLRDVS
jgi:peptidoglycan/LPS O-acetylase OafA/YrhL